MRFEIGMSVLVVIAFEVDGSPVVRPAVITKVWNPDCCNLVVTLDGQNDERHGYTGNHCWMTSVHWGLEVRCVVPPARVADTLVP
ncbi:MAG: hypothetical protein HOP09_14750 [Hyphomicrobium sp.]|nr:hypothetical protein [Hyphomicrobium sp.]